MQRLPEDVLSRSCASRQALDLVASKWSGVIVFALGKGAHRYNELLQRIEGISQKMLTQTLRSLQRDGLLQRRPEGVPPKKVEYSLTPLGESFFEQLQLICKWAQAHAEEIRASRFAGRSHVSRR